MIKIEDVSFKYENDVLSDLNLTINEKKITFILGQNGTGKSTLANLLSGLLFPQKGKITIDNLIINKKTNTKCIREKIGLVLQDPNNQIIFSRVYDDLKFILENMHYPKDDINNQIKNSLKKVNMENFLDKNPYNLSGGEKQRIAIASQLLLNPNYLIFDEATSMLDINGKKKIYELINKLKKNTSIIFITNNIDEIIYADDIIILDNKQAYKYTINDILNNNKILSKHHLQIPFILKIANILNIKDANLLNEDYILKEITND